MKKFTAILLTLVLLFIFSGCKNDNVQIPNPLVDVITSEDFKSNLGFSIDAPKDSTDIKYTIIADELAQVNFKYNNIMYTFRASKTTDDISGVYNTFTDNIKKFDVENNSIKTSVEIKETMDGGRVITWYTDPISYSIFTSEKVSDDEIYNFAVMIIS